jgi:putative tricarboxylic transport membrane protein
LSVETESRRGPHGSRARRIRNGRDFYGGLVLIALAVFAWWTTGDLAGSKGLTFGPGTAPRLFAGLLALAGVAVTLLGIFTDGPTAGRYAVRGPLIVFASVLVFAGTIKSLGLVIATFITILVVSAASAETRWREAIPWAAALSAFCAALFHYGLSLPLSLWPALG